ncbi:MAG: ABC transporter ATP-binding protein/permease [Treponema sp.]|jgi:ATP-binding cassette subfamily B protein|nr:ABC transporter ATP-binding protein/permease [Treponema sp.]
MKKASLTVYKTMLPYLFRYRWQYAGGFLTLLVIDAAQVLIPQIIRRTIDLVFQGDVTGTRVLGLVFLMIGGTALISIGRFVWRFFIHGSSRRIETEMRNKLFEHLLTLSYDFYQKNKTGDLMARAISDLGSVRNAVGWGLVTAVDGTIMAASILIIIFIQDPYTAAYAVAPLPLITILILLFGRSVGKRFRLVQEVYAKLSDIAQEAFAGIRVVKSFVKEWWFAAKFAGVNDGYQAVNMELVKLFGAFFPLIAFLSGLTALILFLIGGRRVVEGLMSPGELVALFSYLQMLIWPLMGAGMMVNMIQRGAVSLNRINAVMESRPAISSPEHPRKAGPAVSGPGPSAGLQAPLIELRNLSFSYPNGTMALDRITLAVEAGLILGILGRTGSGKSTLIKTLPRMVDPPPGTVLIKGIPVGDWDLQALRGLFGVSPQDSYLFSDTVKNNIAYGLERRGGAKLAGDAESLTRKAAALSAIDQDLAAFAQGWDTLIGERGLTLSGGQKQRTAVARALIASPEILILDDALSAVDAETEKNILERLLADRRRRLNAGDPATIILVSHRISTLRNADRVLVLDKGAAAEYGAPQELLLQGGFYAQIAALQRLEEDRG